MDAIVLFLIALLTSTHEFKLYCQPGYDPPVVVVQVDAIAVSVYRSEYDEAREALGLPDYACSPQ